MNHRTQHFFSEHIVVQSCLTLRPHGLPRQAPLSMGFLVLFFFFLESRLTFNYHKAEDPLITEEHVGGHQLPRRLEGFPRSLT